MVCKLHLNETVKRKRFGFPEKHVPHSGAAPWAPYSTGPSRIRQGTGDTQAAAPQATKVGKRLLTGTSGTLFCLQGGRWLGPSFWLPQVSESLGTELHSSAAEVGLMTPSASIWILLTKAFFCQGLSNGGWDWVLAWRRDAFPGQAVSQEFTEVWFCSQNQNRCGFDQE